MELDFRGEPIVGSIIDINEFSSEGIPTLIHIPLKFYISATGTYRFWDRKNNHFDLDLVQGNVLDRGFPAVKVTKVDGSLIGEGKILTFY